MIPFPLHPDETTVLSLLVPANLAQNVATRSWRFLLTAHDPAVTELDWRPVLLHSLDQDATRTLGMQIGSHEPQAAQQEIARLALQRVRESFKAVIGDEALMRMPSRAPHPMLAAARIVEAHAGPLMDGDVLAHSPQELLDRLNEVVAPQNLHFRRLLFTGTERLDDFMEIIQRLERRRLN